MNFSVPANVFFLRESLFGKNIRPLKLQLRNSFQPFDFILNIISTRCLVFRIIRKNYFAEVFLLSSPDGGRHILEKFSFQIKTDLYS